MHIKISHLSFVRHLSSSKVGDDVLDGLGQVGQALLGDITGIHDGTQVVQGTIEAGGVSRKTDQSKRDGLSKGGGKVTKLASLEAWTNISIESL